MFYVRDFAISKIYNYYCIIINLKFYIYGKKSN